MKNLLLATSAFALVAAIASAQTLETATFARDGSELAYRNRAPNATVNFVVQGTGVTFSVADITSAELSNRNKQGSIDIWANNDFGVCYGTATQTCPSTMPVPTTTPSTSIVSKGSKGVQLLPIGTQRIISVTAYGVSGTEFWVDKFKGNGG